MPTVQLTRRYRRHFERVLQRPLSAPAEVVAASPRPAAAVV
jgi:hypothetical protein